MSFCSGDYTYGIREIGFLGMFGAQFYTDPFFRNLMGTLKHKCVPIRMFLRNVFDYAEEDDDVQATRDFATLMDRGYINKYISGGRRQKAIFSYSGLHHSTYAYAIW